MLLSNVDIANKINSGEIVLKVDGLSLASTSEQMQGHGYDLRVDAVYDWRNVEWHELQMGEQYNVQPGETVLVRTQERLKLSMGIAATLHAMARHTLLGLSHISTTVHPGWGADDGGPEPLRISVFNASKFTITLYKGERFCRMLFYQLASEATLPAPTPTTVQQELASHQFKKLIRKKRKRAALGWLIIAVLFLIAIAILVVVQTFHPDYVSIGTTIVVPALSLAVVYVRSKYKVF